MSTGVALVLSVPAALACLAVIAWAPGIVVAIGGAHQDALAKEAAVTGGLPGPDRPVPGPQVERSKTLT